MKSRRGGIGRRAGLKIQWPQGRVGSSPSAGSYAFTYEKSAFWASDRKDLGRIYDNRRIALRCADKETAGTRFPAPDGVLTAQGLA